VALLLGAEAYRLAPSNETASGLQTALMRTPPGLERLIRYRSTSQFPHVDHTGRLLAVPGADGTVTIDDVATGRVVRSLSWPTARQFAVFSGDDRFVAAGGTDGNVVVWDLRTGQRSGAVLHVGSGTVHPVFDPRDDARLYVLSSHGGLSEWDRSDPRRPTNVANFSGILTYATPGTGPDLTISPDGRLIAAGELRPTFQSTGHIWDTRTHALVSTFGGAIGALADDDVTIPFGFGNDTVLFNGRTGRIETSVPRTGGAPLALLSPDGTRLAVAEQSGTSASVVVYDVKSHRRIGQPLALGSTAVYPLGFLADGRLVTSGATTAAVWKIGVALPPLGVALDTTEDRRARAGDRSPDGEAPEFLPKVRDVLTSGKSLVLHDPVSGRPDGTLLGGAVSDPLAGSPDGRFVVGAGAGGLGIWNRRTGRHLSNLPWSGGGLYANRPWPGVPGVSVSDVYGLDWSPQGDRLVAAVGGLAYLWRVRDPAHPSPPVAIGTGRPGVLDDVRFTPDGQHLLMISAGPRMSLVDIATDRTLWSRPISDASDIHQLALAPDGTAIAYDTGTADGGQVTLLDAATGRVTASVAEPTVGGLGYLDHGQWLVVSSDDPDPQAQLYDAQTLTPLGVPFPTADVEQDALAIDPAGTRFAQILSGDLAMPKSWNPYLWNVDPASWVHLACAIAGRNLTRAEWHRYLPDRPYARTCTQWPPAA
jgi:WD40 repeat protein